MNSLVSNPSFILWILTSERKKFTNGKREDWIVKNTKDFCGSTLHTSPIIVIFLEKKANS